MTPKNILKISSRAEFRKWLTDNHTAEKECWIAVKRGETPPTGMLWYLDAVEEALCFGWIDSTVKKVDGVLSPFLQPTEGPAIRTRLSAWNFPG